MIKSLSILAAAALFALIRLLVKNMWAQKAAAVLLPCAAAAVSASWEPLCLIPICGLEGWLDLPGRLRRQTPKEAYARVALIWEEALTEPEPRLQALCAPFQLEGPEKRRGGHVLFNTAMSLCADEGLGLSEYAAAQGFDKQRLSARMPRVDTWQEEGMVYVRHRDRDGLRTFVMGEPRAVLEKCGWVLDTRERMLEQSERQSLYEAEDVMRRNGLKVWAFAMAGEGGCTYLGMAGTAMTVRNGVNEQVKRLKRLGVKLILLGQGNCESTGALAGEMGILQSGDRVMTQGELARLDDHRLTTTVQSVGAYVDLDSADRKRVITAWEQWGETVLQLGPDGLEMWEKALKTGRRLEKNADRLQREAPLLIFAPCAVNLAGAALELWPICAVAVLMSIGLWAYQLLKG